MKNFKIILLSFLLAYSIFFAKIVYSLEVEGKVCPPDLVTTSFSLWFGVPQEYLCFPDIFWLLILPYIATLAIIYGIFEEIGILRRATHKGTIYFVIAVAWALFLIPTGFLGTIAVWMYTFGAFASVITFMGIFFVGIAILWRTRILVRPGTIAKEITTGRKQVITTLEDLYNKRHELELKIAEELRKDRPDQNQIAKWNMEIAEIDLKIKWQAERKKEYEVWSPY